MKDRTHTTTQDRRSQEEEDKKGVIIIKGARLMSTPGMIAYLCQDQQEKK